VVGGKREGRREDREGDRAQSDSSAMAASRGSKGWVVLDLIVAVLLAATGVLLSRSALVGSDPSRVLGDGVMGAYLLLFSVVTGLAALFYSAFIARYFAAAYSFAGKAFGYLFLGSLCVSGGGNLGGGVPGRAAVAMGVVIICVAALCLVLQFVSSAGHPVPLLFFGAGGLPPPHESSPPPPNLSRAGAEAEAAFGSSPKRQAPFFEGGGTSMAAGANPWTESSAGANPFRGGGGGPPGRAGAGTSSTTTTTTGGRGPPRYKADAIV
jgi:hypothetical protein